MILFFPCLLQSYQTKINGSISGTLRISTIKCKQLFIWSNLGQFERIHMIHTHTLESFLLDNSNEIPPGCLQNIQANFTQRVLFFWSSKENSYFWHEITDKLPIQPWDLKKKNIFLKQLTYKCDIVWSSWKPCIKFIGVLRKKEVSQSSIHATKKNRELVSAINYQITETLHQIVKRSWNQMKNGWFETLPMGKYGELKLIESALNQLSWLS